MLKTGPKPRNWEATKKVLLDRSYMNEVGCFIWTGCTAGEGYGVIRCDNENHYVHRLIYNKMVCDEPVEVVRHSCDTPRCWNPEHLLGGTHADNVEDKVEKDRHMYGTRHYRASISEDQAREIRESDLSVNELTEKFKVSRAVVNGILCGKNWKHV